MNEYEPQCTSKANTEERDDTDERLIYCCRDRVCPFSVKQNCETKHTCDIYNVRNISLAFET